MPRMRRPRHPQRRTARAARDRRRDRHAAQPFHVRVGHRLLVAVHLLHEDLRVPFGARPRQRRGHGCQGRQPAPQRLGHHGRRRLAGHRRQPLHTRHPPQCRPERHTLQQRDLRPHQGAVLPHLEAGQDHQDLALRHGRKAVQPRRTGDRRQRHVLRPLGRHGGAAFEGVHGGRCDAQRHVGDRSTAKLRDFQRQDPRCIRRRRCATAGKCCSGPTWRRESSSRT